MHPSIADKTAEIAEICKRFGVRKLEVFGSAARGDDFDSATSDADFLVEFEPGRSKPWMGEYFDLEEALAALLGRPVDVVSAEGVRNLTNRYRLQSINKDRVLLYAA